MLLELWNASDIESKVTFSNKSMSIPFKDYGFTANSEFVIKKLLIVKKLDIISHYFNYFLKFYDLDDEFIRSYGMAKNSIDRAKTEMIPDDFMIVLENMIYTEDFRNKVVSMVEYNLSKNYIMQDNNIILNKLYFELVNKNMFTISIAIKLVLPLILHYINTHQDIDYKSIYKYINPIFKLFNLENMREQLYNLCYYKVKVSKMINMLHWKEVEEAENITSDDVLKDLFEQKLIVETLFKFEFGKDPFALTIVTLENNLKYLISDRRNVPLPNSK